MSVSEMRKVLALVDELKQYVKRGVSDDVLYEICAKHICKSDKGETQSKASENAKQ